MGTISSAILNLGQSEPTRNPGPLPPNTESNVPPPDTLQQHTQPRCNSHRAHAQPQAPCWARGRRPTSRCSASHMPLLPVFATPTELCSSPS
eukprot:3820434-Prymnesium_polylepis.2